MKKLLRLLGPLPSLSALAQHADILQSAQLLVRIFYGAAPFAALLYLAGTTAGRPGFDPLWPVVWAQWASLSYPEALIVVNAFLVISALFAALFYQYRALRILLFIALWQAHALESSFGSINHQWYPWVYVSFIFIFLPTLTKDTVATQGRTYLFLIWLAQAVYVAIYTLAGIHKTLYAFMQALAGDVHSFHPYAFAYQVADWLPRLQHEAVLARHIVEYPFISWPFYVALVLIQLFSWIVLIRFNLQRSWALLIFLFHIGTYLTMGIEFQPFMLLLLLLFMPSPFPAQHKVRTHAL